MRASGMDEVASAEPRADGAGRTPEDTDTHLSGARRWRARGIAHVAAWEVLDGLVSVPGRKLDRDFSTDLGDERFCLTSVAGASAGAKVAAFIAAGAKAQDLIDENGEIPLRNTFGIEHLYDLFLRQGVAPSEAPALAAGTIQHRCVEEAWRR